MGKGRIFGSIAALVICAVTWNACGNSNDQGISFRALGFFSDATGTNGDAGRCASLDLDNQIPQATANGFQGGFLGLQNNLLQGMNVDHVNLSYHVNGSNLALPSDVFALSVRLGPSSGQESSSSRSFAQIEIVSANIFKLLNDNRSRLPEPPFSMVVFATAVGTTDSGDVFQTNRVNYEVEFFDGNGCVPATPVPTSTIVVG